MAPFVPAPDTLQANVRFTTAGQRWENVLHFLYGTFGFSDGVDQVYNVLDGFWWPTLRTALALGTVHREVYFVDLADQFGFTETRGAFTNPAGVVNTNPAPNNVAACVTLRTDLRGRAYRGRTYVGGIALGSIDNQNLSSIAETAINDAFASLVATAQAERVPLVIVSRQLNNAPRTTAAVTPVTSASLRDSVLDSQRRRLPGRGT